MEYNNKTNIINWFDLDGVLWITDAKWWIVDKKNPDKHIIKISQYEGSLIVSGFYKKDNLFIHYNGLDGWLSKELYDKILKIKDISIENIGFSWREFNDSYLISKQLNSLKINMTPLAHINPKIDIVNILTARSNKNAHIELLNKLENELKNKDLFINDSIFVNDINNISIQGNSSVKKCLYILQNIIGYKIDGNKFVPIKCQDYNISNFYDDQDFNINECDNINKYLSMLLDKTMKSLKDLIISDIFERKPILNVHLVTTNELNPFTSKEIKIFV